MISHATPEIILPAARRGTRLVDPFRADLSKCRDRKGAAVCGGRIVKARAQALGEVVGRCKAGILSRLDRRHRRDVRLGTSGTGQGDCLRIRRVSAKVRWFESVVRQGQ